MTEKGRSGGAEISAPDGGESLHGINWDTRPDPSVETMRIGDDAASDVFDALASSTSRDVLQLAYGGPVSPSDVSEETDTSLQNAHHHLDKLEAVGLIERSGWRYTVKGTKTAVYTAANDPLVLIAGSNNEDNHYE